MGLFSRKSATPVQPPARLTKAFEMINAQQRSAIPQQGWDALANALPREEEIEYATIAAGLADGNILWAASMASLWLVGPSCEPVRVPVADIGSTKAGTVQGRQVVLMRLNNDLVEYGLGRVSLGVGLRDGNELFFSSQEESVWLSFFLLLAALGVPVPEPISAKLAEQTQTP